MYTTSCRNTIDEELQAGVVLLFIDYSRSLAMYEKHPEWLKRVDVLHKLQRGQFMLDEKVISFLNKNG